MSVREELKSKWDLSDEEIDSALLTAVERGVIWGVKDLKHYVGSSFWRYDVEEWKKIMREGMREEGFKVPSSDCDPWSREVWGRA